ncbi:neuromedin-U receptor 2-like [Babylonia areolata]|uniref:neuromedin-U receptor 2-like n=1 Tax=Babylonia areolata TaxID=304850 RepID=UPI003FD55E55
MMEESVYLMLGNNNINSSGSNLTLNHSLRPALLPPANHTPDVERLLTSLLGARRKDLTSVMALTLVYCLLFLTGVVGNVSTCIVIARNSYMHTVTNCYLFSLAVSDVLTLIFALPPELFSIWEAYPWQWGESFCLFKTFLMETTSYATVLTITGFTAERYVAICHPLRGARSCGRARAVRCIISIWLLSAACALPYPIHTRLFYFVQDPRDGKPVPDSLLCSIPVKWHGRMRYVFQVSTFVFFLLPMGVISVMYALIGVKLRRKEMMASQVLAQSQSQSQSAKTAAARARRAVLRMLVAVVVAFFLCWAPYHAQRLMTLYIQPHQWTSHLLTVQSHLFYVSGVLYFLSSTVNPILYHVLSRKFRQAFKRTLCRCCLGLHVLPPFHKLQAKLLPPPSSSSFSSATHAHSDGRLLALCRHRKCSCRRAAGLPGGPRWAGDRSGDFTGDERRVVTSYPDVNPHRLRRNFRGYCHDDAADYDQFDQLEEEGVAKISDRTLLVQFPSDHSKWHHSQLDRSSLSY